MVHCKRLNSIFDRRNSIFSGLALLISVFLFVACENTKDKGLNYPIVDTQQGFTYDNYNQIIPPDEGEAFYGQDAQYTGNVASYTDNGDGTITDNVTGLMWTQELSSSPMPWSEASSYCEELNTGGHSDWRLPSVKELWSLRNFSQGWPWIDTDYFHLVGDGTMLAEHHSWSCNQYLVESEYQNQQLEGSPAFIVNDWTGHIKAMSGSRFVRAVRGNTDYGVNKFVDNGDGTVSDNATGLMWSQDDNGEAVNWEQALSYAENATIAGYDDWRLPNIKELQSLADYSGVFPSIDTTFFNLSEFTNVKGQTDYPFYWSSTTNPYLEAFHEENPKEDTASTFVPGYTYAWIIAAGYCPDKGGNDLHGSGAVVFDTKSETVSDGSGIEVFYHHVRLVRGGGVEETPEGDPSTINTDRVVEFEHSDFSPGQGRPRGGKQGDKQGGRPDLEGAAKKLGVTQDELKNALGDPSKGRPDFTQAAKKLDVSEKELIEALGAPSGDRPDRN